MAWRQMRDARRREEGKSRRLRKGDGLPRSRKKKPQQREHLPSSMGDGSSSVSAAGVHARNQTAGCNAGIQQHIRSTSNRTTTSDGGGMEDEYAKVGWRGGRRKRRDVAAAAGGTASVRPLSLHDRKQQQGEQQQQRQQQQHESGSRKDVVIHWFRKGLRLHDNPSLLAACEGAHTVYPVFVLDPHFFGSRRSSSNGGKGEGQRKKKNRKKKVVQGVGKVRCRFLLEALSDLDATLQNRYNSRLFVVKGSPYKVFPNLISCWGVNRISWEHDTEPYARVRDAKIAKLANEAGVEVAVRHSHTLYNIDKLVKKANHPKKGITSYSAFLKFLESLDEGPGEPLPPPRAIPRDDRDLHGRFAATEHTVPTLTELGYPDETHDNDDDEEENEQDEDSDYKKKGQNRAALPLFPGGESYALKRMHKQLSRVLFICQFSKPKTNPTALQPATTALSPYLKFGCLSARLYYWEVRRVYQSRMQLELKKNNGKQQKKKHLTKTNKMREGSKGGRGGSHGAKMIVTKPPQSLEGQLLWREFFYFNSVAVANYDRMEGNPICKQIPWRSSYGRDSEGGEEEKLLHAWENARTGYPYVDAIMTELKETGWVHHIARHMAACFLTRGDLWISWERGAAVFSKLLVDADYALNNGNWMWVSASAFFDKFDRVYHPVFGGKKRDRHGAYVRKWLPVLRRLPDEYVWEPWRAPKEVQVACGCVVGKDYPFPVVDHDAAAKANLIKMRSAYAS